MGGSASSPPEDEEALNSLMSQLLNERGRVIHLCTSQRQKVWTLHLWNETHQKWYFFLHSDRRICSLRIRLVESFGEEIKFLGKLSDERHFFCVLKSEGMSEQAKREYLCTAAVYFRSNYTDYTLYGVYVVF